MSNVAADKMPVGECYWEKYGIPYVSLSEALWNFELSITSTQNRGVWCFISEAGEGKSQGVHGVLRKHGYRIVDIRTAQLTHVGAGVPQRAVDGFFDYAVPADFPREGEKAAMVFDEINQGQQFAIALMFKLFEDRGLYGYKLPTDCPIVLMMNPSTAQYNVTKLESNPAINRRIKKFYVHNTFSDWKKHAQTDDFHRSDGQARPCHPWVLKFLNTSPNMLYTTKDRDGNKQFCCPATWQTVSLDLYNLDNVKEPLTSDRAENRLAATINTVNARALVAYIKNNALRISPDEILFKYKEKSKLRERILQLKEEPGGDYINIVETVAQYIFDEKPDCALIAPQLALYWRDMPRETAGGFYQMLGEKAQAGNSGVTPENIQYMQRLTVELNTSPYWEDINRRINAAHDNFEHDLNHPKEGADEEEVA